MDAQVKKSIDARTREFKEKLAKLTYEKIKQTLVPSKEPLKGYPHNESVEEESDSKEYQVELDELDSKTYRSYIDKAQKSQIDTMDKKKQTSKDKQTMRRRSLGIATAKMKQYGDKRSLKQRIRNEEVTISLDESVIAERLRLRSPNKLTTIDIDYIGSSSDINQSQREYNIKIKKTGRQMADVTGKKGDIVKFLQGDAYAMDDEDIKDIFPELLEGMRELESMFGLRATDWRKLVKKHKRDIDAFQKGRKDLPKNVEDELLTWAMDNGEVQSKDDAEDFIDIILNA
jgi:hypothetical protein